MTATLVTSHSCQSGLQYSLKPDDQLCFLHIPKTAGSTLTALMDTNFYVHEIFPGTCIGDYEADVLATYRLFRGHYDYIVGRFFHRPPVYATMLRDPIERVISLYEFWKRDVERGGSVGDRRERSDDLRRASLEGLAGFVCNEDPWVRLRTCNRQARQLAIGIGGIQHNPSEGVSDEEILALAQQHLDECAFWGLTERFQESIFLMAYVFGWCPVADYQNLRVARRKLRKDSVDPDVLHRLMEANQVDLALYAYAQERFSAVFAQMLEELRSHDPRLTPEQCQQLASNQVTPEQRIDWLLPILDRHHEQRYGDRHPNRVDRYDFNCLQPLSGSGWHRRNGKKNGVIITTTPFRWTGPSPLSTMNIPLAPGKDCIIRLVIVDAIAQEVLDSLQIRVNDHPLTLTPLEKRPKFAILQGFIEADWLTSDRPFTRLTFEVSHTASPHSLNPTNPDTRLLGVAVHRLQILPISDWESARDDLLEDMIESFPCLQFRSTDPYWRAVADVLARSLKPGDRLMAPGEFSQKFPQYFCSFLESLPQIPQVNWVVVHKGRYRDMQPDSLFFLLRHFRPVFANPVFVIFSRRHDISPLSPWTKDVMVLTSRIRLLQMEQAGLLSPGLRRLLGAIARWKSRLRSSDTPSHD